MLQIIKAQVELVYGKKVTYQKDCKCLSDNINSVTGQYISPSTLRRLFGFLLTNSNPSLSTLDTLSRYCNFADWDDFVAKNENIKPTGNRFTEFWFTAQAKAHTISKRNCAVFRRQIPIGFSNTVIRQFLKDRISYFLKSEYIATPLVGPAGFGKTTFMAGWAAHYISQPQNANDIILLIPATALESLMHTGPSFEHWLLALLGIDAGSDFFAYLANPQSSVPGKFILIVDALDKLTDESTKSNKIFSGIHGFINHISSQKRHAKVIVTTRHLAWRSFFKNNDKLPQHWYFADNTLFTSADANIPPFNKYEIQAILDNTINCKSQVRILVEELSPDILKLISYPYFIQLFIAIFNPETTHLIGDRLDLLTEFISKVLYNSQHSEEKMDILNKLVDLSMANGTPGIILKNTLKKFYPIHLKLSGNYYQAYNQLLSFGIMGEESIVNRYGSYSNEVRILQWPVFELLLLQRLIDRNKHLDFSLFQKIESDFSQSQLMPNLLCLLFEIAYKNKNATVLKKFFTLSDRTLSLIFSLPSIPHVLQRDDYMRNALIPHYAKDLKARKYLFEGIININNICNSWKFLVYNYLQHSNTERDIFFAKTMLCISGLLSLDLSWVNKFLEEFPDDTPVTQAKPYVQGLWFSCKIICTYFSERTKMDDVMTLIINHSSNCRLQWGEKGQNQFDYGLVVGLAAAKQGKATMKLLQRFAHSKPDENTGSVEIALIFTYEYVKWKNGASFNPDKVALYEAWLNQLPQWNNYIPIIWGKNWIAMYYLSLGNVERTYHLLQKGVEISNLANYLIFEVRMLKKIYKVLLSLGEFKKAAECESFARGLVEKKTIDFNLL